MPIARDQGQRPTCLPFATTAVHEFCRSGSESCQPLSEEMLYQMALSIERLSDGTTIPSIELALSRSGQCRSCLCPYQKDESAITISSAAIEDGLTRKAVLTAHSVTFNSIAGLLMAGTPVILVVRMCQSFFETSDGSVETPNDDEVINDLHAIVAVGIVNRETLPVVEFRNSWGREWGDNGYGYLRADYIDKHCTFAGIVSTLPSP